MVLLCCYIKADKVKLLRDKLVESYSHLIILLSHRWGTHTHTHTRLLCTQFGLPVDPAFILVFSVTLLLETTVQIIHLGVAGHNMDMGVYITLSMSSL